MWFPDFLHENIYLKSHPEKLFFIPKSNSGLLAWCWLAVEAAGRGFSGESD